MKSRKIIYIVLSVILIIAIFAIIIAIKNKKPELNDHTICEPKSIIEQILATNPDKKYLKLKGGEILNKNTNFSEYAFISNNSIYIFNPQKLDSGEFEYKKVYDIDKNIKVMNIRPSSGADIKFIDYNDTLYTLHDENLDNKVRDSYDMFLNADYKLNNYLKWEYSTEFLGKKTDYDFMSNYVYVKDNILYRLLYNNDRYPAVDKVSGNYEGEKVIRIYNERILKTDKAFYEIVSYFDNNLNKTITTTIKINLLTKYYNDVLTFTYKYVILKDYTLIPINDVMINRANDYQYNEFISSFNSIKEVPKVFEE